MLYFLNHSSNQGYPRLTRDEKPIQRYWEELNIVKIEHVSFCWWRIVNCVGLMSHSIKWVSFPLYNLILSNLEIKSWNKIWDFKKKKTFKKYDSYSKKVFIQYELNPDKIWQSNNLCNRFYKTNSTDLYRHLKI